MMKHLSVRLASSWSRRVLAVAASVVPLLAVPAVRADDWPQWQGPERNSVSKETGLLKEWPKEGPPLAWKVKGLGGGFSSPSITAGKIYGMSVRGDNQVVWALDESDGKELWVVPVGLVNRSGMRQGVEGPGCTPTVDGDRLYVVGSGGEVTCLQTADGKQVWQKSFTRDFGGRLPTWRFNESPLVDGDKVVVTPGGAEAMLVALNKMTGETIWKSVLPGAVEPAPAAPAPAAEGGGGRGGRGGRGGGRGPGAGAAYSSPIAIDFEGHRQYVQLTAKSLIGVSAADGKLLWQYDKPANRNGINITTPLYVDGHVFAASAYGAGGGLVKLSKTPEGGVKAEEVWFTKQMQNHHGGAVVVDGALYGANGGNEGGFLICLDFKTGNVNWDERNGTARVAKGSIALADGRIYYRTESGTVLLIEPNAKAYTERGRFEQPDRSPQTAWPHPVIANGKLYVRDQDVLLCYDVKAK